MSAEIESIFNGTDGSRLHQRLQSQPLFRILYATHVFKVKGRTAKKWLKYLRVAYGQDYYLLCKNKFLKDSYDVSVLNTSVSVLNKSANTNDFHPWGLKKVFI